MYELVFSKILRSPLNRLCSWLCWYVYSNGVITSVVSSLLAMSLSTDIIARPESPSCLSLTTC